MKCDCLQFALKCFASIIKMCTTDCDNNNTVITDWPFGRVKVQVPNRTFKVLFHLKHVSLNSARVYSFFHKYFQFDSCGFISVFARDYNSFLNLITVFLWCAIFCLPIPGIIGRLWCSWETHFSITAVRFSRNILHWLAWKPFPHYNPTTHPSIHPFFFQTHLFLFRITGAGV